MFAVRREENGTIHLSGVFDSSHAEEVAEVFRTVTSSCTVDCKELEYISSAGLGILIGAYKRVAVGGGKIRLVHAGKVVREIFRMARFDKLFDME